MLSFSDTEDITRSALTLLVAIERRHTGSRLVAYANVAELIGSSSSWVQKFIRDSGEVQPPKPPLLSRINTAYTDLCNRVEQENERDEMRLRILKGQIDALARRANAKAETETAAALRRK